MIEVRRVEAGDDVARLIALADDIARLDRVAIPESLSLIGSDAGAIAFAAMRDGAFVGFATAWATHEPEISVAVHPGARRQGIGRMLLNGMRAELRDQGHGRALIVAEEKSKTGAAFLDHIGAEYAFSEFRLERPRGTKAVRSGREDLSVREATGADREVLIDILAAAFGDGRESAAETVDDGLAETDRSFALASVDGVPIGVVRTGVWSGIGDITALGVLPNWQGKGYGRALLLWAVDRLESAGHSPVALEVETDNANALGLYQSCGFVVTNEYTYSGYRLAD